MLKRVFAALLLISIPAVPAGKQVGPAIVVKAAENLIGGPYVVNVGPKTATVAWVTKTAGEKLGPEPDQQKLKKVTRAESLSYKHLAPGTTYYYDFQGTEKVRGYFKTAPVGPAPFHFVVYGDTRSRHDVHQKVVDAVIKAEPDFVIHTGDFVSDGTNTALWPIFFSIEKELLRHTVLFPALGNHDRNSPQYFNFFQAKPYYSFNWGTSHFVILDSDLNNAPGGREEKEAFWQEQTRWLEDDLGRARKADLRIVAFHHPPYSAVARRSPNEVARRLVPILEKYKVDVVFNGHDHNYAHFLSNGVHYIVTGGGGAPLYPVDGPIPGITVKVASAEHFVDMKVQGKKAVIEAIGLDGQPIDRIELNP